MSVYSQEEARATAAPAERSLGDLFSDLTRDTAQLVRQEVNLAKTEVTQKATRAGKDVGMIAAGGAVAYIGLMAIVAAVALLLVHFGLSPWLAALLTGLAVSVIGGLLAMQGVAGLKRINPVPQNTVETLKEDAQWLKEQR